LVYRSLVQTSTERCPNLHALYFAEQLADPGCQPGRINLESIWKALRDPLAVSFYLAGPPEMLRAFTQGLAQKGVGQEKILVDAWE
jgi:ferredoxin-NADP reductase